MDDPRRLVVQKIVRNGRHGPYAVVKDPELGSITFSLLPEVWNENRFPETGSEVIVCDFESKTAGWRAMSARFFRPSDVPTIQVPRK